MSTPRKSPSILPPIEPPPSNPSEPEDDPWPEIKPRKELRDPTPSEEIHLD
jgi:hypothetical protein